MVDQDFHIAPYVERISKLNMIDARALEKAIEQKPWCSAYRILLARCHENEQSFSAEQKLNLASLYTGNREVLFEFMHSSEQLINAVPNLTSISVEQATESIPEASIHPEVPVSEEVEEKPVTVIGEAVEEPEEPVVENNISEEIRPAELEIEEDPEPAMEEETAREEVKRGFEVDFDSIVTYDPTRDLKPQEKSTEERIEIPFERIAYNPEVELEKLINEKRVSEPEKGDTRKQDDPHDFFYWLDHVKEEEQPEQEQKVEEIQPVQHTESNVDQVSDLLDKFLASKKRMTPKISTFYDPERKARESELDESELVSESLANLYIRKELYEKALQTLRKLILQNPSKSAYFAARIEEVERMLDQSNNK